MASRICIAIIALGTASSSALADYSIIQQNAPSPTYGTTLNFDEPGGPTGNPPGDAWASLGLATLTAGVGPAFVGEIASLECLLGDNKCLGSGFIFMVFDRGVTEMSVQVWDSSGQGDLPLFIELYNNGVPVWSYYDQHGEHAQAAWECEQPGDSWFNITATDGMVFDWIVIGSTLPTNYAVVDNISWNLVPDPKTPCDGDANADQAVDLADLNLVLANFGTASEEGDLDDSGSVDLADLNLVLANFGNFCGG
ncbi:MAG: hypothetical protein ABL309_11845 [Phycisphaerales bacterium]